jgi:cytochrome c553
MSKKSLVLLVITALTLSLAFGVSMSFASDVDKGPAKMKMNAEGKKYANFDHAAHQKKNDCGVCHHKDVDGKRVGIEPGEAVAKCLSCHTPEFPNEKLRTWRDVGHGQCKGCHNKMKAEGAPTKCSPCHEKKKKPAAK